MRNAKIIFSILVFSALFAHFSWATEIKGQGLSCAMTSNMSREGYLEHYKIIGSDLIEIVPRSIQNVLMIPDMDVDKFQNKFQIVHNSKEGFVAARSAFSPQDRLMGELIVFENKTNRIKHIGYVSADRSKSDENIGTCEWQN